MTERDMKDLKGRVLDELCGLKDELEELQKYMGRKTAKILGKAMKLEEILRANGGEK